MPLVSDVNGTLVVCHCVNSVENQIRERILTSVRYVVDDNLNIFLHVRIQPPINSGRPVILFVLFYVGWLWASERNPN